MVIKEQTGYYQNGAWYPYKEVVVNVDNVVLEDPVKISRYPGNFDIKFSFKATEDEIEQMMGVFEDLEVREYGR